MTLGTYLATVVLEDFEGNVSNWPITIQVSCASGNRHPLCYTAQDTGSVETTDTGIIVEDDSVTTVSTISSTDSLTAFTADYEVVETLSLSETVEPADPSLEDDEDFEDVEGVLTQEQAASAIEEIVAASSVEQEF